eukprot:309479-Chlamydomonas_euryale.AAC.1
MQPFVAHGIPMPAFRARTLVPKRARAAAPLSAVLIAPTAVRFRRCGCGLGGLGDELLTGWAWIGLRGLGDELLTDWVWMG